MFHTSITELVSLKYVIIWYNVKISQILWISDISLSMYKLRMQLEFILRYLLV
jgi:hypothetical protein